MTTVASNLHGKTYEQQIDDLRAAAQQKQRIIHWDNSLGGLGGLGGLSNLQLMMRDEPAKTLSEQMQMDMDSYLKDWDKGDCDE